MDKRIFRNDITLDASTEVVVWKGNDIKSAKFVKLGEVDFGNKNHRPVIIRGMDYTIVYKDKDNYYAVDMEAERRTWIESILGKWNDFLTSKGYLFVGEDDISSVYVATKDDVSQPLRIVNVNKRCLDYMFSFPKSSWSPVEAWVCGKEYSTSESDDVIMGFRTKESPALKKAWDSVSNITLVNKSWFTYKSCADDIEWCWNGLQK